MSQAVPIACSLPAAERPDRSGLMADLGATRLTGVRTEALEATLRFANDEETRAGLRSFVDAESQCCPFFEFELRYQDGAEVLDVRAPQGGEWAIRALVAGFVVGWGSFE
jgi:hypothetical protein